MSHHSDGPGPEVTDETIKRYFKRGKNAQAGIDKILNLGPTGDFPHGKLTDDDAGGMHFSVGFKDDKVIMDVGDAPVRWIGMTADDAREVGRALMKHAKKIRNT